MKSQHFVLLMFFILAGALLLSPATVLAKPIGKAKMVFGKVVIQTKTGESKRLIRGEPISSGDTITTNKHGQVQLIMLDGSNISVRPGSKFQITEFVATGNVEKDKTHYALYKGGIRSVTGSIGKKNKSAFKLRTPVATMTIRGTDFISRFCNKDCPANVENGLFTNVISGGVSLTNRAGNIDLTPQFNGYVANPNQMPDSIKKLPENLLSPKKIQHSLAAKQKNQPPYPSPEEELVQIGIFMAPNQKRTIMREAMAAGMPMVSIINGASSGGLAAEEIVTEIINQGKEQGFEVSDLVQPILASKIRSDNMVTSLMATNPDSAADILTAAIASGQLDINTLKSSARQLGVSNQDIKSAEAVGNLLAIPEKLMELLEENSENSDKQHEGSSNPARIRARELAPSSDNQNVASPS